jgi:zinc protease
VANPARLKECLKKVEEQINLFDSPNYFTDEQIEIAKKQLSIDDIYGSEKTSSYVHTLTFWWASASLDYQATYIENLNKVTREDIVRYVRQYIKGKPRVCGVLLSEPMMKGMGIQSFEDLHN